MGKEDVYLAHRIRRGGAVLWPPRSPADQARTETAKEERPLNYRIKITNDRGVAVEMLVSRLPSTEEKLKDWLDGEIVKVDEQIEPNQGILFIDLEQIFSIEFMRTTRSV